MFRLLALPIILVAILALGGCASTIGTIAGVLAKPVLGLAVKDADTTLAWVNKEVAAGRLTEEVAVLARQCPEAVLALEEMRTRLGDLANDRVDGFKGLIYLATKARFGQSIKEEATFLVQGVIIACGPLIPADRLINRFL